MSGHTPGATAVLDESLLLASFGLSEQIDDEGVHFAGRHTASPCHDGVIGVLDQGRSAESDLVSGVEASCNPGRFRRAHTRLRSLTAPQPLFTTAPRQLYG